MKYFPTVVKNSAIYSIVSVLQRGIMFFLLPLYTSFLSPEDFGIVGVVTSVSSFVSIFILFSLDAAATRFYYKNKDPEYSKKLWGTVSTFVIFSSVVVVGLFILLHKYILDPFLGTIEFYPYILLGFLNTFLSPLYLFFQTYLQTRQEGVKYGINSLLFFLLQVGLTVTFLYLGYAAIGVLMANLITSFVFFIYVIIAFIPKIKLRMDKGILSASLKYSIPLIPHNLATWSNGMIDKLFLNGMKGKEDAGLYNAAQQFSGIIGIVATSMNKAYVPWFFEQEEKGKEGLQRIRKFSELIVVAISMSALIISLFSKEVLMFMVANQYKAIWTFIPILCFGNVFQSLYYIYVNVLFLKHTKIVFLCTVIAALVNVVLNIVLIPTMGIIGAALAFSLSIFIRSVVTLIFSMVKNKNIRFPWLKLYTIAFAFLSVAMTVFYLNQFSIVQGLIIKFLIIILLISIIIIVYKNQIKMLLKIKKDN